MTQTNNRTKQKKTKRHPLIYYFKKHKGKQQDIHQLVLVEAYEHQNVN